MLCAKKNNYLVFNINDSKKKQVGKRSENHKNAESYLATLFGLKEIMMSKINLDLKKETFEFYNVLCSSLLLTFQIKNLLSNSANI